MSALDKMRLAMGGPKGDAAPQQVGQKQPNMMEAAMLRMLEGVGLDAGALNKMQSDVAGFATFVRTRLDEIHGQNVKILAAIERIENDNRNRSDDGK